MEVSQVMRGTNPVIINDCCRTLHEINKKWMMEAPSTKWKILSQGVTPSTVITQRFWDTPMTMETPLVSGNPPHSAARPLEPHSKKDPRTGWGCPHRIST